MRTKRARSGCEQTHADTFCATSRACWPEEKPQPSVPWTQCSTAAHPAKRSLGCAGTGLAGPHTEVCWEARWEDLSTARALA